MEFKLTQEQAVMKETARVFAFKALSPIAGQYDEKDAPYPSGWMEQASEMGFMNMLAPSKFGGAGAKTADAGLTIEELAGGCAGMAMAVVSSLAGVLAVLNSGAPDDIKDRLLGEPYRNNPRSFRVSAAGLIETPFRVKENGTISGREAGVPGILHVNWYAVLAREGSETTCWIFEPDTDGFDAIPMRNTLGLRAAQPGHLKISNAEGLRLGSINSDALLALVSPLLGAAAVGCARAALNDALNYSRERYQGGDVIIKHDIVAQMILSNIARVEAARSRLFEIMAQNDALIDEETGALKGKPNVNAALLARVFAVEAALQATIDAVQCFGGYGYMHDYPVEKRMRDARSLGVIFGSNPEIMNYINRTTEGKIL